MANVGTLGDVMTDSLFKIVCRRIKLRYLLLEAGIEIPEPREAVMLNAFITIKISRNGT